MINMDVINGNINAGGITPDNTSKETKGTDALGKDAFLQLLVAQLQYQDPLNPSSNQEFLGELAQFSSLEELQNLTSTLNNNNSFSLIGKNVIVQVGSSEGKTDSAEIGGYVEYVQMSNGKAQVSIGGELYDAADVTTVIDDAYLGSIIGGSGDSSNSGSTTTEDEATGDEE